MEAALRADVIPPIQIGVEQRRIADEAILPLCGWRAVRAAHDGNDLVRDVSYHSPFSDLPPYRASRRSDGAAPIRMRDRAAQFGLILARSRPSLVNQTRPRPTLHLAHYNITGLRTVTGADDAFVLKLIHETRGTRIPDPEAALKQRCR